MPLRNLAWCLFLTLPLLAQAQDRNGACRADVDKYCSQSAGNGKQAMDCLLEHQQDISDACYETLKQRVDRQQGMKACKQDAEKYCQGTQPGGGRIVRCLMDHQKEVSDDCYDTLAKAAKAKKS